MAQTMIRVKDINASLHFYRDVLGMSQLCETHMGVGTDWGFSLFFLATHLSAADRDRLQRIQNGTAAEDEDGWTIMRQSFTPVLELTHNHGTESRPDFHYHNGNDVDESVGMRQGFGHIGFLVDDLNAACAYLQAHGVRFKKLPHEGKMRSNEDSDDVILLFVR